MRIPSNWSMELLIIVALFISVVVTIFAMQAPPGDRTRFTLERSDTQQVGVRRAPSLVLEEATFASQ